jgi:hypothetical protein
VINGSITRRQFLHRLGALGGAGITLGAMGALGLSGDASMKIDYQAPSPVDFSPNEGAGVSVLIIGADIAGLTCAYEKEFETSFSNDWRKTRFSEGSWVNWPPGTRHGSGTPFARLLEPAGRVYFAGDYLSYAIARQHGAFESARKVVTDLHARVLATQPVRIGAGMVE